MTGIDGFHGRVARIALAVARHHGFVLGGGLALIAHGTVARPTRDVDLFGPESASVADAADAVRSALIAGGVRYAEVPYDDDLAGHMVELVAYRDDRDGDGVPVSLSRLAISRSPVLLDIGPVMDLRDLAANKIAALVTRAEVRDFIDAAVFLADRTPAELIAEARRVDPAVDDEDVLAAGRRLDATPDRAFAAYRLDAAAVATVRERFAAWPR